MKNLLILLAIALFSFTSVMGQNALFVDFDYTYDRLLTQMKARTHVKVVEKKKDQKVVIAAQGATYTYHFNHGWLYKIDMTRVYTKRRSAREAFDGCLSFFSAVKAENLAIVNDEKFAKEQVYATTGNVYSVQYDQLADKSVELTLSRKYTANTPLNEWEQYDYQSGFELTQTMTMQD